MGYSVVVRCNRKRKRSVKWELRRYGVRWAGDNHFYGRVNAWKFDNFAEFCSAAHLQYSIQNGYGERSNDYRSQFFRHNIPIIGNAYFCSYCGKLCSKKKITIDHLYPVGCAKKSVKLQKKLRRMGIENINSIKNLVPACGRCNKRKSAKMGIWILKGKIGRFQTLWILRHCVRIVAAYTLIRFLYVNEHLAQIINLTNI